MIRLFKSGRAFTLIELMAVVLVIALLVGISLGVIGYVQKRVAIQTTRAEIAAVEAALEIYKGDWGYYPPTAAARISVNGMKEASNNCTLLNALCPTNRASGRKVYLRLSASQIRTNYNLSQPTICDFWGVPLNYYNSPTTPYAVTQDLYIVGVAWPNLQTNVYGYTLGGQVNVSAFDLFSYGPDQFTFTPGVQVGNGWDSAGPWTFNSSGSFVTNVWMKRSSAQDDIANFKQ